MSSYSIFWAARWVPPLLGGMVAFMLGAAGAALLLSASGVSDILLLAALSAGAVYAVTTLCPGSFLNPALWGMFILLFVPGLIYVGFLISRLYLMSSPIGVSLMAIIALGIALQALPSLSAAAHSMVRESVATHREKQQAKRAKRARLRAHKQHVKRGNEQRANRARELQAHDRVLDKAYAAKEEPPKEEPPKEEPPKEEPPKEKLRVQGRPDKVHELRRRETNRAHEYAAGVIKSFLRSKMALTENIQAISTPFVEFCALDSSILGMYRSSGNKGCQTDLCFPMISLSDILLGGARNDIQEVIIHEVAHHIDTGKRGMSCHDSYWEAIHHSCGGKGNYLASHGITGGAVTRGPRWEAILTYDGSRVSVEGVGDDPLSTDDENANPAQKEHDDNPL